MQIRKYLAVAILLAGGAVQAAETNPVPLEEQLRALDVANQAPAVTSKEKLYSVQTRLLPLTHKNEFSLGGGLNLTGDSFLNTEQAELSYRFHFNDRWSLGASYAVVANQLSKAADHLRSDGIVPDVPYAKTRGDFTVEYNVFYGKFRWSMDRVFYFDQYLALGGGVVQMNNGESSAVVADAGLALWLGRAYSARLGLKDYYYNETYRVESSANHNLHAHLDIGYLF